jgi:hypothetical protein
LVTALTMAPAVRRHDADDLEAAVLERERPADNVGCGREPPAPQAIADERHGRSADLRVRLIESAAHRRRQTQHVEQRRRNADREVLLHRTGAGPGRHQARVAGCREP